MAGSPERGRAPVRGVGCPASLTVQGRSCSSVLDIEQGRLGRESSSRDPVSRACTVTSPLHPVTCPPHPL